MPLTIRRETPADVAAIEAVTVAAFLNAPHTSHTEQFIVNALRKAGKLTISLVAEEDGQIVGHVAVSPVLISDGTNGWFGLGPISPSSPSSPSSFSKRSYAAFSPASTVHGAPAYQLIFIKTELY